MNSKRYNWEIWIKNSDKLEKDFNFYLKFVNFLLENNKFSDWAIAGCYYTIYHCALALLAKKGYSSKKHNSTLCALIKFYNEKILKCFKDKNFSIFQTKRGIYLKNEKKSFIFKPASSPILWKCNVQPNVFRNLAKV